MDAVLLAQAVGQRGRFLDDHHACPLEDRAVPAIGGAEVEVAFGVHGAGLQDHDVDRIDEAPVIVGDLAQVHRQVVGDTDIVLPAVVSGEMKVDPAEMLAVGIRLQHRTRSDGEAGPNLHAAQLVLARGECSIECVGLAEGEGVVDPRPRLDEACRLCRRDASRRSCRHSSRRHASPIIASPVARKVGRTTLSADAGRDARWEA